MGTKHTVNDFMEFVVVKGTMVSSSFRYSSKVEVEGVMFFNSKFAYKKVVEDGKVLYDGVLVTKNNEEVFNAPKLEDVVVSKADDSDIEWFNGVLKRKNLAIRNITIGKVIEPLGKDSYTLLKTSNELVIDNVDNVKFKCRGQLYTREEFESLELGDGEYLMFYFDDGYSYLGVEPVDKLVYLAIVDKVLDGKFTCYFKGIELVKTTDGSYCVNVRIGKGRYSEISNS